MKRFSLLFAFLFFVGVSIFGGNPMQCLVEVKEIRVAEVDTVYHDVDFADMDFVDDVMVEEDVQEEEIFIVVSKPASFPGGIKKMYEYLSKNMRYPKASLDKGSRGTTTLRFVVEKDGRITHVEVIRYSGDSYLDKEAIRLASTMPKWQPAEQNGRAVRSYFTLPVKFMCK